MDAFWLYLHILLLEQWFIAAASSLASDQHLENLATASYPEEVLFEGGSRGGSQSTRVTSPQGLKCSGVAVNKSAASAALAAGLSSRLVCMHGVGHPRGQIHTYFCQ